MIVGRDREAGAREKRGWELFRTLKERAGSEMSRWREPAGKLIFEDFATFLQ